MATGQLRLAYFTAFDPGGSPMVAWDQPGALGFDYLNLEHWQNLARKLEAARFDAIFWADHSGVHDRYQASWEPAVRSAVQFPLGDPVMLTAALAGATEHLGYAFSANVIQEHPYSFARRLSTLDHLTRGRIGWNIVTSFQESAWRNLGYGTRAAHADRYARADDYMTVLYKLLEGSWDDDAVVRDLANRVYADPAKVRPVHHEGDFYSIDGLHPVEPSPQRVPVLFQAGTSEDGRRFAASNAEAMFVKAVNPAGARSLIGDMKTRLEAVGRRAEDLLFFQAVRVVVGSTEAEAKRKDEELKQYLSEETALVMNSSMMDSDLSEIDLDSPIGEFKTDALQGRLKGLVESAPNRNWTFRQLVLELGQSRFVGSPEQIADHFEEWRNAGIGGINLTNHPGTADLDDFLEHVVPELQRRGLVQREYTEGTLRQKLFPANGDSGKLNERHPAASFRSSGVRAT